MRRRAPSLVGIVLILITTISASQDAALQSLDELEQRLRTNADDIRAANEYRREVIRLRAYDRGLRFFKMLVKMHPRAANAYLNYGFAYVDKIPAAGSITQVILANSALMQFTAALELRPSWIGYYTRGNSYLFWPKIFGRAPLGIADLEQALRIQRQEPKRTYHARAYLSLGDGYWKTNDIDRARAMWQEGLREFPGHSALQARLAADASGLARIIDDAFDHTKRVDTDLSELWSER